MRIEPILPYQIIRASDINEPVIIIPKEKEDEGIKIDVSELLEIGLALDMMA